MKMWLLVALVFMAGHSQAPVRGAAPPDRSVAPYSGMAWVKPVCLDLGGPPIYARGDDSYDNTWTFQVAFELLHNTDDVGCLSFPPGTFKVGNWINP